MRSAPMPNGMVEVRGEFADGEAVSRRDRVHADERREPGRDQRALHDLAANRVGPIQHDERDASRAAAFIDSAIVDT